MSLSTPVFLFGPDALDPSALEWAVTREPLSFLGCRELHVLSEDFRVMASMHATGISLNSSYAELVGFKSALFPDGESEPMLVVRMGMIVEALPAALRPTGAERSRIMLVGLPVQMTYQLVAFPEEGEVLPELLEQARQDAMQGAHR
jgi:hypothetical protein